MPAEIRKTIELYKIYIEFSANNSVDLLLRLKNDIIGQHGIRVGRYWRYYDVSRYIISTILVSSWWRYFLVPRYYEYRGTYDDIFFEQTSRKIVLFASWIFPTSFRFKNIILNLAVLSASAYHSIPRCLYQCSSLRIASVFYKYKSHWLSGL